VNSLKTGFGIEKMLINPRLSKNSTSAVGDLHFTHLYGRMVFIFYGTNHGHGILATVG